jgi:hypothetical protein
MYKLMLETNRIKNKHKNKKKRELLFSLWVYGCFLATDQTTTAMRTIMRTIITADNGRKYRSAIDCGVAVVGEGVTLGACITLNAVSDDDCQYESEPAMLRIPCMFLGLLVCML